METRAIVLVDGKFDLTGLRLDKDWQGRESGVSFTSVPGESEVINLRFAYQAGQAGLDCCRRIESCVSDKRVTIVALDEDNGPVMSTGPVDTDLVSGLPMFRGKAIGPVGLIRKEERWRNGESSPSPAYFVNQERQWEPLSSDLTPAWGEVATKIMLSGWKLVEHVHEGLDSDLAPCTVKQTGVAAPETTIPVPLFHGWRTNADYTVVTCDYANSNNWGRKVRLLTGDEASILRTYMGIHPETSLVENWVAQFYALQLLPEVYENYPELVANFHHG